MRLLLFTARSRLGNALLLLVFAVAALDLPMADARTSPSLTVVVDAGHGGFDRGGVPRQRASEKNMTLDIAQRLKRRLKAAGYRVVMTRDSDVFISLPGRVRIANSYRNAIFVSIHTNSASRLGANGIETYYYGSSSMRLASNIHRNVIAGAPTENRGIRRRGYYVLRKTDIPAVLVECGFLTNPMEARLILTSQYREKLADEIARGIMGRPPERVREPASRNYPAATVALQPFARYASGGTDFVKIPPERSRRRSSARKKRSRKKKSSSKKSSSKKSSSSKKKKKKSSED